MSEINKYFYNYYRYKFVLFKINQSHIIKEIKSAHVK